METYYIKNSGNDANTGLSDAQAWTFAKLASFTPVNGDTILFNRGETFIGSLDLRKSSVSGSVITYGAYGSGAKPIITSLKTLTGWTLHSAGIYKISGGIIPENCDIVTINDVSTPMGQFPQTGWNQFETFTGRASFVDNQLTGTPNFTGAEVVIKKSNWTIDRGAVTNHTTNTVTYTSGSSNNPQSSGEYKYFFQKSLNCLLKFGDWYSDGTTFYMYFGANSPDSYTIKAGGSDYTVYLYQKNYNKLENLQIEGGNLYGVYFAGSVAFSMVSCDIKNCGLTGITGLTSIPLGSSTNTLIDSCTIKHVGGSGAWINSASSHITDTTFEDCGEFAGHGDAGGGSHYGIYIKGAGTITEYNTFNRIGYIPINFYSNDSIIRYNKISNYPLLGLDDGGAIYSYYGIEDTLQSGIKVYNNIIQNSSGNGLYPDNLSNNQEWYNNTVIAISKWPIHCNMPQINSIHDNTVFGCGVAGIDLSNLLAQATKASSTTIASNTFVQTATGQKMISLRDERNTNDILNFGTSNGNKFIVDNATDSLFYNVHGSSASLPYVAISYNFTDWKTLTGDESTSALSVETLSKISIIYNDSKTEQTIALAESKIDLTGTVYANTITLQPFTSKVLISYARKIMASADGKAYKSDAGKIYIL